MPMRPQQHRAAGWRPYKEDKRQVRLRQSRRALATNSAAWRKLRAVHLAGEPLCRHCAAEGRVRAATDVDHVDGDDANNAPENLQSLCRSCHGAKTARENGGFGRNARAEPRNGRIVGGEGYPTESERKYERKGEGEGQS